MSSVLPKRSFTLAEYMAIEREGNVRHEFVDGELVAMTGTSREHNTIAMNLGAAIRPHLRGSSCRIASSDMKVVIAEAARGYYPDLVVSCSDPSEEPDRYTETRPVLVVEILSPSTEAFDRSDKCDRYRRLPSLRNYVLVSQDTRNVEVHERVDDGWVVTSYEEGETVVLSSIGMELPMSLIYEDVPPPAAR